MKPESNTGSIHVFRVQQAANARSKSSTTTAKKKTLSTTQTTENTTKNSRTRMSAKTKRFICQDHIENSKITQEILAARYGCKRTTIAKILKCKDRWMSIDSEAADAKKFRQRNSRYPLVENALLSWLQKEQNNVITDQMIRSQARQYAQTLYADGSVEFKASSSWVAKFKQNYMQQKILNAASYQAPGLRSATPDTLSLPSGTPTTNASVKIMSPMASNPSLENTAVIAALISLASPSFASSTNDSTQKDADHDTNMLSDAEITTGSEENEIAYDALVDNMHRDDFDMDDCCDADFNPGPFDNSIELSAPESANNNQVVTEKTQERESLEENATSLKPTTISQQQQQQQQQHSYLAESVTTAGLIAASTTSIPNTIPQQQQHENTKLSAKQHLEAALAFYTSQNGSNASMSASMIKLILQNDF